MGLRAAKIDTLSLAKELENAGIPRAQAEAQIQTTIKVVDMAIEEKLVTKHDLTHALHRTEEKLLAEISKLHSSDEKLFTEISKLQAADEKLFTEISKLHSSDEKLFTEISKLHSSDEKLFTEISTLQAADEKLFTEISKLHTADGNLSFNIIELRHELEKNVICLNKNIELSVSQSANKLILIFGAMLATAVAILGTLFTVLLKF